MRSVSYVLSAAATVIDLAGAHGLSAREACHRYFLAYRRSLADAGRADDLAAHDARARAVERVASFLLSWRDGGDVEAGP